MICFLYSLKHCSGRTQTAASGITEPFSMRPCEVTSPCSNGCAQTAVLGDPLRACMRPPMASSRCVVVVCVRVCSFASLIHTHSRKHMHAIRMTVLCNHTLPSCLPILTSLSGIKMAACEWLRVARGYHMRNGGPARALERAHMGARKRLQLEHANLLVCCSERSPRSTEVGARSWLRLGRENLPKGSEGRAPRGAEVGAWQRLRMELVDLHSRCEGRAFGRVTVGACKRMQAGQSCLPHCSRTQSLRYSAMVACQRMPLGFGSVYSCCGRWRSGSAEVDARKRL